MTVVSSGWFVRHRQDFIRAHLQTFGQIRRSDIMGRFEVTAQTASADIARFVDMNPEAIIYDGRAKIYVLDKERAALSGEKGQP